MISDNLSENTNDNSASRLTANRSSRSFKPRRLFRKISTFTKNIVCLAIWAFLISWTIRKSYPVSFDFLGHISIQTILFILVCILGLVSVFIIDKPWKFGFWSGQLFRLLFFPLIALYYIVIFPYIAVRKILRPIFELFFGASPFRAFVRLAIILFVTFITTVLASYTTVTLFHWLVLAMLLFALFSNVRFSFLVTSHPLLFLDQAISILSKYIHNEVENNVHSIEQARGTSKYSSKIENLLRTTNSFKGILSSAKLFTKLNSKNKIVVKQFVIIFLLSFLLTILLFGIAFHQLHILGYPVIPISQYEDLTEHVFYSLLIITTSADISASSALAKTAIATEIVVGIGLVTLLILQFSTVSFVEADEARTGLLQRLDGVLTYIEEKRKPFLDSKMKDESETDGANPGIQVTAV